MSKAVEPIKNLIKLSTPIVLVDGKTLEEIKVREPIVKDFRRATQLAKSAEDREMIVVAACCDLTLEDLELLSWKDYSKVRTFLFGQDDDQ